MGYFDSTGYVQGEAVTVVPSTTATAAGSSAAIRTADFTTARLTLSVTAVGGTSPSLTVTVETSHNGTTWAAVGSFAAATAVGTQRKVFSGLDNWTRTTWAIAGTTPSATFSVPGALL